MRETLLRWPGRMPGTLEGGALKLNLERADAMLEFSSEILSILDAHGTILYANGAAGEGLGWGPEALRGKAIFGLVHPEEAHAARKLWKEAVGRSGAVEPIEWRVRRRDGAWLPLAGQIRNLLEVEAVEGVVLIARDISERKGLEKQLWHAQRVLALGQLTGGVAHEFSNLLSVILGYGGMVAEALEAGHPCRADVQEMMAAAGRATELVDQLLSVGSPQTDSQERLALNQVVEKLIRMLIPIVGHGIRTITALDAGTGAVKLDPGLIEQVLLNLALNSRDAMPSGGTIRIGTEPVRCEPGNVPGVEAGDYALLTFSDTGRGMSAQVQSRIFDPFFTTKARGKGTGLGLSTVHSIVREHGGAILVESAPERGTTFRIYIPRMVDVPWRAGEPG
ncbi:MAG: two-component system sensor histidine kinase NtrB [Bryobacteraceae bacterium]